MTALAIYFIQQGDDGPIKIGTSTNPTRRLSYLQVGNPVELRLIGTWPDAVEGEEAVLHEFLAGERIRGEWFRPTWPVRMMANAHDDEDEENYAEELSA